MNNYPAIRNILSSVFSVQTGLDDDAAAAAYHRALRFDPQLSGEIGDVFADDNVNWSNMLFNEEYEVYEAESEADARTFAIELLQLGERPQGGTG